MIKSAPQVCTRVIVDVFLFLELNELERNQLVSRDWNGVVKDGLEFGSLKPRRRIRELFISSYLCKVSRHMFTFPTVIFFIHTKSKKFLSTIYSIFFSMADMTKSTSLRFVSL